MEKVGSFAVAPSSDFENIIQSTKSDEGQFDDAVAEYLDNNPEGLEFSEGDKTYRLSKDPESGKYVLHEKKGDEYVLKDPDVQINTKYTPDGLIEIGGMGQVGSRFFIGQSPDNPEQLITFRADHQIDETFRPDNAAVIFDGAQEPSADGSEGTDDADGAQGSGGTQGSGSTEDPDGTGGTGGTGGTEDPDGTEGSGSTQHPSSVQEGRERAGLAAEQEAERSGHSKEAIDVAGQAGAYAYVKAIEMGATEDEAVALAAEAGAFAADTHKQAIDNGKNSEEARLEASFAFEDFVHNALVAEGSKETDGVEEPSAKPEASKTAHDSAQTRASDEGHSTKAAIRAGESAERTYKQAIDSGMSEEDALALSAKAGAAAADAYDKATDDGLNPKEATDKAVAAEKGTVVRFTTENELLESGHSQAASRQGGLAAERMYAHFVEKGLSHEVASEIATQGGFGFSENYTEALNEGQNSKDAFESARGFEFEYVELTEEFKGIAS